MVSFLDLHDPACKALSLKTDLWKNSFGHRSFISWNHGQVEVTVEIRVPSFESYTCLSSLNCPPRAGSFQSGAGELRLKNNSEEGREIWWTLTLLYDVFTL